MIPRRTLTWLAVTVLFAVPVLAQPSKTPTGPRAVALLEWTPEGLRLIPISLYMNGQYNDATLFMADPVPMALQEQTLYQVQQSGERLGDFTVTGAAQLPNKAWIGEGKYVSEAEKEKKAEERAKEAAAEAKLKAKQDNPIDDRPILRRETPKKTTEATPAPAPSSSTTPAPTTPASATVATPPPATSSVATELTDTDDAPGRPILRRDKPIKNAADYPKGAASLPHKIPPKPPVGLNKVQVAVSDAKKTDTRPYTWKWANPDEEQRFLADTQKLALAEVANYAAKLNGPKPGKLEDVSFRAFDLSYNNEPQIILTARVSPALLPAAKGRGKSPVPESALSGGFEYYVTVVATEDIYGQMQKIFSSVTDNKHLDAFPRYELIDAVDADGTGNGDLLFHRISDISRSFVLYRVYGNSLQELVRVPEPRGY